MKTKIVICSAYDTQYNIVEARRVGADHFIVKPVKIVDIRKLIGLEFNQWKRNLYFDIFIFLYISVSNEKTLDSRPATKLFFKG